MPSKGLIIGAGSGIGKACLERLSLSERTIEWYAPTHEELDVRHPDQFGSFFRRHPDTEYIVYSAGINHLEWLGKYDPWDIANLVDVNLNGFMYMMNAAVKYLPSDGENAVSIVVIGSDAAERPLRTSIAYCASKAGLHMAVRAAARELGRLGWRINTVAPGMTHHTEMQRYVDERVQEVRGWTEDEMLAYERSQEVVPGRILPHEVAQVVASTLFGPAHLNGSTIYINGGR